MNKLYEKQSYLNNIPTVITSSFEKNGKKYITLEDTIFFPEEGGQYADTGYLISGNTKINILDGQLHGEDIWYEVDSVVDAGNKVTAVLDWDKRFLRMQNHSGEHIISGLINKMYGLNNVGFHLSDDKPVTLDMDGVLT